ncbi:MAG: hypothetical protein EBT50_07520, partial [Verrucomicrobia bacterium]|nr:hypothetical protein [Verrucomicrobiota bacterium]
ELKLGGGDNPTSYLNMNVLSSSNQAVISKVSANSGLTIDNRATFTVANGSQDVDLLVSANLNQRGSYVGNVTKQGAGVMTVSGSNTYTGATIVGGGTLRAGSTRAFGVNSAVTLSNLAGTSLDLNGFNNSIGSLAGGGTTGGGVTLGATIGGNNASTTYGGAITGTGGLVKTGSGRQILTGASSFTGETKMQGGMLRLAGTNGSALYNGVSGKVTISHDGTGNQGIYSILEIGAANQLGANVDLEFDVNRAYAYMSLLGNNTEVGNLSIIGTRLIQNFEGVNNVDGSSFANATFTVNQTRDDAFSGFMRDNCAGTGTLQFIKKGAATLTIQGANVTHTGGTRVMEGRVISQGASLGGSGSGSQVFINSNAVLEYKLTNAPGFANGAVQKGATISGAGTLEKTGQGALIFGGSGQVNVAMDAGSWIRLMEGDIKAHNCVQANWDNNKASLFINTNSTFWQVEGNVTVGALGGGGTLNLGYSWPNFQPVMKFSGRVTEATPWGGKGILTKIGKGTQTFSGTNNVITGNFTVNDGIVNFSNTGKFTAQSLIVGDATGTRGRVEIQDGNTIRVTSSTGVVLGRNGGVGALYQSGGLIDLAGPTSAENFLLGDNAGSYGYFRVSGGTNDINEFGVGSHNGGNGSMDVTGGLTKATDYFLIGRGNAGTGQTGVVNLLGGTIQVNNGGANTTVDLAFNAGFSGATGKTSIMTVANDATLWVTNRGINLNYNGGNSTGILNLNGGTVKTAYIRSTDTAGNQFLNFNGGTIAATMNSWDFLTGVDRITINQGGAKFDTAGFNVGINQSLQAPAGKGLSSIAIANGGSGYIAPPIIEISGGGGSGATAYAEIDRATGAITNIVISNPGNGYTSPPTVVLKQGGSLTAATLGTVALADNVSGGITKQGNGVLTLSAGNTYTGTTLVSQGTLRAGVASNAFGITSAMVLSNASNVLVELNGFDQTIGSLAGGGSTGGTVSLGSKTLTLGSDNTSTTFSGTITGTNGQIVKIGTGNQTFTASNGYTGLTTVSAG